MKLVKLQRIAIKGYAHGESMGEGDYFNPTTGLPVEWHTGDTLEWFLAIEIAETYDADALDYAQLAEAMRAIQRAIDDLQGAWNALSEEVYLCQQK
ncbi:MAG: hypothetical protein PHI12_08410 [Dehalococcoidales bacterium]|nr:hypothetical protein [Dehalococcoidales bacterium]